MAVTEISNLMHERNAWYVNQICILAFLPPSISPSLLTVFAFFVGGVFRHAGGGSICVAWCVCLSKSELLGLRSKYRSYSLARVFFVNDGPEESGYSAADAAVAFAHRSHTRSFTRRTASGTVGKRRPICCSASANTSPFPVRWEHERETQGG